MAGLPIRFLLCTLKSLPQYLLRKTMSLRVLCSLRDTRSTLDVRDREKTALLRRCDALTAKIASLEAEVRLAMGGGALPPAVAALFQQPLHGFSLGGNTSLSSQQVNTPDVSRRGDDSDEAALFASLAHKRQVEDLAAQVSSLTSEKTSLTSALAEARAGVQERDDVIVLLRDRIRALQQQLQQQSTLVVASSQSAPPVSSPPPVVIDASSAPPSVISRQIADQQARIAEQQARIASLVAQQTHWEEERRRMQGHIDQLQQQQLQLQPQSDGTADRQHLTRSGAASHHDFAAAAESAQSQPPFHQSSSTHSPVLRRQDLEAQVTSLQEATARLEASNAQLRSAKASLEVRQVELEEEKAALLDYVADCRENSEKQGREIAAPQQQLTEGRRSGDSFSAAVYSSEAAAGSSTIASSNMSHLQQLESALREKEAQLVTEQKELKAARGR